MCITWYVDDNNSNNIELDWDKCIICQHETVEPSKCPLQGSGTSEDVKIETYRFFLTNVEQFWSIGPLQLMSILKMKALIAFQHTEHHGKKLPLEVQQL